MRRYSRILEANAYYKNGDRAFRLRETGYTINADKANDPDAVLAEVQSGNMDRITNRDDGPSMSERSKLNGESREDATVRINVSYCISRCG